jgi:RNA polymerase sigma-54 factor
MIGTGLHLQIGHSLSLTPQLQQAIRLLQYSSLELTQEIEQMLASNMMLSTEDELMDHISDDSACLATEVSSSSDEPSHDLADQPEELLSDIPEALKQDIDWSDVFDDGTDLAIPPVSGEGPISDFESYTSPQLSLYEHLKLQLDQSCLVGDEDYDAALTLIDALDLRGYLTIPLEELVQTLPPYFTATKLEQILDDVVQQFEPTGVGARHLQECLLLQLYQFKPGHIRRLAIVCVDECFHLLSTRQYAQIERKLQLKTGEIEAILDLIRQCNPEPGRLFDNPTAYIKPDLYLIKHQGEWRISLNSKALPRIEINQVYAGYIRQVKNPNEAEMMRTHLQEAKWFLKSIQNRNETLLRVGQAILEKQRNFFDQGPEAMRPMTLKDVAELLELHESTISRATSHKYLSTPMGTFELKYFFNSQVQSGLSEGTSSLAIQAKIRKLVEAENPKKPLSDNRIAELLNEDGIPVARRTIAKYREAIHIPSSSERRKMKA